MLTAKNISGQNIRFFRKKLGLSQSKLAAKAQLAGWDIGRDVVVKVETGSRCVDDIELVKFAQLLGVTPNDLLPRELPRPTGANNTPPAPHRGVKANHPSVGTTKSSAPAANKR